MNFKDQPSPDTTPPALTVITSRSERLRELEATISSNLHGFYEVGKALKEIRDDKHYKDLGFKRFEDYCRHRWGLSKTHVNRQIESSRTVDVILTPIGVKNGDSLINVDQNHKLPLSTTPLTEGAIRPISLSGLSEDQKREVWQKVMSSGKPITEKSVKTEVVDYKTQNNIPLNLNPRTGKPSEFSSLIKPSDNWNFAGITYGRIDDSDEDDALWGYIPGEIYLNCFWYYVTPGDLVVAPMAGAGQVQRVYEARQEWMGSHAYDFDLKLFDLNPRGKYKDLIGQHDLVASFPPVNKPDYIIMDIPYFGMVAKQYSEKPEDLANMDLDAWVNALSAIAHNCVQAQDSGKLCTVISPNYRNVSNGQIVMTTELIRQIWEGVGYSMFDKAYATRRIQQAQTPSMARMNNMAKERRVMLTDISEILTFQHL